MRHREKKWRYDNLDDIFRIDIFAPENRFFIL